MSANPAQIRTPYAALGAKESAIPQAELAREGEKLAALRAALWAAFEAGPEAGLPNTLIDLTLAYTSALRLQLNLRALASAKSAPGNRAAAKPDTAPRS